MRLSSAALLVSLILVVPAAMADHAGINQIYKDMGTAYRTLDLGGMERIYTPDVSYLMAGPGETQWQAGRADVLGGFKQMFDGARAQGEVLDIRFRIVNRTLQGDDAAVDTGHFKLTVKPKDRPAQVMTGTFITMPVKRADGTWAFAADSWGPVKEATYDKAVKADGLQYDE